jgi:hypothetical protein
MSYHFLCKLSVSEWMSATWEPILGYSPVLQTFLRGWFGFVLKNPEDIAQILDNFLVFEGGSLMLKMQKIMFDLMKEYFSFHLLRVFLPGLPL